MRAEYVVISFDHIERGAASVGIETRQNISVQGGRGHRLADGGIVRFGRLCNWKQREAVYDWPCVAAPFIFTLFRRLAF